MASNTRLSVLRNRSDFTHILKNGQRIKPESWLLVNYIRNKDGRMRCGWTLPRQVGNAVVRNRLKRWSRAYFRDRVKRGQALPLDINLVFRKPEGDFYKMLKYEGFERVVDRAWEQLERRIQKTSDSSHRHVPDNRNDSSGRRMPV